MRTNWLAVSALGLWVGGFPEKGMGSEIVIPEFPKAPTMSEILVSNGLDTADERTLLNYVSRNWVLVSTWLPDLARYEEDLIAEEYLRRSNNRADDIQAYWRNATAELYKRRLADSRRIVDAVLRELGRHGTAKSIGELTMFARSSGESSVWARWKALASVVELMSRIDPDQVSERDVKGAVPDILATTLNDLPQDKAEKWAWRMWQSDAAIRYPDGHVPTRLWLARFFAPRDPKLAAQLFRQGLEHYDIAIQQLAATLLRSGMGGSLDWETSADDLLRKFDASRWSGATPSWDVMPEPLSVPFPRKHYGGRVDLVWLDVAATVRKTQSDVWPDVDQAISSRLQLGKTHWNTVVLATTDGNVRTNFPGASSAAAATHGGLWLLSGSALAGEYGPDGTTYWQCPISRSGPDYRYIAPHAKPGQILLLGYQKLDCIDRRGDRLWSIDLAKLDDPRCVLAVENEKLLLTCGKSVGWLDKSGNYKPVVSGLGSALWVAYHPESPWVVFDGSNWEIVVFDPKSGKITGRFDSDDGGSKERSRFRK